LGVAGARADGGAGAAEAQGLRQERRAAEVADIYERIFSDVNRRYVIGFYPANKAHDGGRRRVSIEVRGHPEYTVWGRKSYYAPGPDR
jgi:hypothetical protein